MRVTCLVFGVCLRTPHLGDAMESERCNAVSGTCATLGFSLALRCDDKCERSMAEEMA